MMDQTPEMMTFSDFLNRYSVSRTTAYREANAGRLRLTKLGTATRVTRADAEAWRTALPVRTGSAAHG